MTTSARSWFRIAVAREGDARPQLVAASGAHMGDAIAAAVAHAGKPGSAWAVAAELASEAEIPLGEAIGKEAVVTLGEAPEGAAFRWPSGVIPALRADARAVQRGFVVRPGHNQLVIEAQPDGPQLVDVFMTLIEKLPTADNLEIRVLDHFEDAHATDVWLTSRINAHHVLRFLDDHDHELLGNGHVEVSIYVRKLHATLRLTEHKTIVWLAKQRALESEIASWLAAGGVPPVDALVTARELPHFHYRPAGSRDRKKLGDQLFRERLRRVDVVKRA